MIRGLILVVFLFISLPAQSKGNCSPIFKKQVKNSRITLNCTSDISIGLIKKLEKILNEPVSLESHGNCSPQFYGNIINTTFESNCGISKGNVQKLINDFVAVYYDLKQQLSSLELPNENTKKLQLEAAKYIEKGDFDSARSSIDEIIKYKHKRKLALFKGYDNNQQQQENILINIKKTLLSEAKYNALNGKVMYLEFNHTESVKYFLKSLNIIKELQSFFPDDYQGSLFIFTYMVAKQYYKMGKYSKSELYYENSLEILNKYKNKQYLNKFFNNKSGLSVFFNDIAHLYMKNKKYNKAEAMYKTALKRSEDSLGYTSPEVATILSNLSQAYIEAKKYNRANIFLDKSIKTREKNMSNISNIISLNTLINNVNLSDRYLVSYHYSDVSILLSFHADLYFLLNYYSDAELLYKRSLFIQENTKGKNNVELIYFLKKLADFYQNRGKLDEAYYYYSYANRISELNFGIDHPKTKILTDRIAFILEKNNSYGYKLMKGILGF